MSTTLESALLRTIRAERARLGISQAELGRRMGGWHRQTVWKLENGQRPLQAKELPELCEALEIGLLDLLARISKRDREALRL